jgi:pimeloyl-ACP methyl ester carboxylesterase
MASLTEQFDYATENLWPLMKLIHCPTLILRGEKSQFLSRQEALKMCEIIPNAVFAEIPDSTHIPLQENPGDFKKVILTFLHEQNPGILNQNQ